MRRTILNREFQHPADGWYQIEALGHHRNRAAGLVQVVDAAAATAIVSRFNTEAAAGQLRHGHEMLIDHEHFSDQPDQETRAYGWLQELQNRDDGIYGRIRWTSTGRAAVDGGDYRFFSTEYDPADLRVLNAGDSGLDLGSGGRPKTPDARRQTPALVRPLRLAGLTLTNMNNNRGQRPITNRGTAAEAPAGPDGGAPSGTREARVLPDNFASASAPAESKQTNATAALLRDAATKVQNKKMKTVCTLLGLSADADEASVHAAVSKLLNRGDITPDGLTTLRAEHKTLGETNQTLLGEQLTGLLAEHGIKDEKVVNRLTPVLTPLKNREDRLACLADLGFKPGGSSQTQDSKSQTRILNRGAGTPESDHSLAGQDQATVARKIKNRANELKGASPKRAFDDCWQQAAQEIAAKG